MTYPASRPHAVEPRKLRRVDESIVSTLSLKPGSRFTCNREQCKDDGEIHGPIIYSKENDILLVRFKFLIYVCKTSAYFRSTLNLHLS